MRPAVRRFAVLIAAALPACHASDPPPVTAPPAPVASASPATSASAAASWSAPASGADVDLQATCGALLESIKPSQDAAAQANAGGIAGRGQALEAALGSAQAPPDWPPVRTAWCKDALVRGIRDYLEKSIDTEAQASLHAIARSAVAAFERETMAPNGAVATHVMCPSAKKIPASLDQLTPRYASTEAEWHADKGWSCLKFEMGMPQRFQYEVKVDPRGQSLDAIARRKAGTQLLEISIHVERTKDDALRVGDLQTKRSAL